MQAEGHFINHLRQRGRLLWSLHPIPVFDTRLIHGSAMSAATLCSGLLCRTKFKGLSLVPPDGSLYPLGARLIRATLVCIFSMSNASAMPPSLAIEVPAVAGQTGAATEAELLGKIQSEIAGAPCDDNVQCRTMPMGTKACGGPEYWLPWSTLRGRADRLRAWRDELAGLQGPLVFSKGSNSNCLFVADPGALCQARQCVVRLRNAND